MSRRDQIRMTDAEVEAFVAEQRVVTVATTNPNGRPHLAPLWYVPRGIGFHGWTYAASQKARNLERLPQATVQIEAGDSYDQLRGVSMECDVKLLDPDDTLAVGIELARRYTLDGADVPPELVDAVGKQAAKRVGLAFTPTKIASWDHRKLGGTY